MSTIQKVAVVGGSGNVGVPIIEALLESGFVVTAITRIESTATFPTGVTVKRVDVTSVDALAQAFKGQDAVVSTVATVATNMDKTFIDAALAAKVRRFIPSEFGADRREARGTKFGDIFNAKIEHVEYLSEVSKKHDCFTWTALSTGPFFDWSIKVGLFGIDFKNKTAKIFDSGNEPYSPTTLSFIGKCIVAILKQPDKTANKYLTVASFTATQREVLKIFEEETGSKFQITNVTSSELEKVGDEKLASGDPSAYVEFVIQWLFADGCNHAIKDNAVKLLGLEEEDLRTVVKKLLTEI
ncbi:related to 2`-hydroxyisoflavone reductase [Phialocephala subalpina]|uniref:Related to 2`-hydroxyisoflavone reductase n=1 Tax=Phialocephala subalpina TaxID=576137 RepID=A0A1L7XVX5_9HELO|nr:related to 2`-hydroxyisoflavone reductase [Phialocephala subalpina]